MRSGHDARRGGRGSGRSAARGGRLVPYVVAAGAAAVALAIIYAMRSQRGDRREGERAAGVPEPEVVGGAPAETPPLTPAAPPEAPPRDGLDYTLRDAGRVSVNIYDEKGAVVRELLHAAPRKAGRNVDHWDQLDGDGKPAPAGKYTWKLLKTRGLRARYLLSVGSNYAPGAGDWRHRAPGTHGGAGAVAADEGGVYVAAMCTENIENYLLKQTTDGGERIWSAFQPEAWTGGIAAASAGGTLYVLATNGKVWPFDAASGRRGKALETVWPGDKKLDDPNSKVFTYDMDACGGHLVVSYSNHDAVRWFDHTTGKVAHEVTGIKGPLGVTVAENGTAFVISGKAVLRLDRAGAKPITAVGRLTDPVRVDMDHSRNEILVAEWGDSQQVKRFSTSGRFLKTYGLRGGRKDGLYTRRMQESFVQVTDVAADGRGGFLVCEPRAAPRRVAHLDRDGRLIREWYGGQTWGSWIFPEPGIQSGSGGAGRKLPGDPSAVWMNSHWDSMMRMTVDYAAKTWKVHSTYRYGRMARGLVGGHGNAAIYEGRQHDGELYLCRVGDPCVLRVDRKAWQLVPVAVGAKHIDHYRQHQPELIKKLMGDRKAYLWTDTDGDGEPQDGEITFYPNAGPWHSLVCIDDMMGYFYTYKPWKAESHVVARHGVSEWNRVGAPVYEHFPEPETILPCPARVTKIEGRWGSYFWRDIQSGDVYGAFNDRMTGWGKSTDSFLVKWSRDGEHIWTVGRKGLDPGEIDVFRRFVGMTHGCVVLTNFSYEWPGQGVTKTYVWDRDGLWVGELFENPDLSAASECMYALGAEALAATLHTDPRTGEVLLFGCGLNEGRVYHIEGWDGWERAQGTIEVARAGRLDVPPPVLHETPPGDGTGLKGEYFSDDGFSKLVASRVDPVIDFTWGKADRKSNAPEPLKSARPGGTSYSVRWTGLVQPRDTGLHALLPGGSGVAKVWVDGKQIPRAEGVRRRVHLEAGRKYEIKVEYSTRMTHPVTEHGVKLQWVLPQGTYPGSAAGIPRSQLYPPADGAPATRK